MAELRFRETDFFRSVCSEVRRHFRLTLIVELIALRFQRDFVEDERGELSGSSSLSESISLEVISEKTLP